MAEEFTHQFLEQAFSVGQQVNMAFALSASYTLMGHINFVEYKEHHQLEWKIWVSLSDRPLH